MVIDEVVKRIVARRAEVPEKLSLPQSVNLSPAKLQISDILHPCGQRRV